MNIHVLLVVTLILSCYSVAEESINFQSEDDNYSDSASYYDDNLGNSYEGVENVLSQEVIIDDIGKDEEILTAIIDKYIDRLFGNVHRFAVAHGLDPIPLPDVNRTEILRAHVVLTNGTFNGVSTIGRENHVKLIYNHKTRVINVKFPIIFHDLSFRYHYDVGAMFAKEKGFFTGIMKNYKVTVDLNFDFKKYHLKMAKPLWVNGIVIVKFDKSPFAIIKTIIGSLVSAVLTPLINAILSGIFSKIGNKLVSTINDDLDRFLHRNSTNVANSINNLWELLLV